MVALDGKIFMKKLVFLLASFSLVQSFYCVEYKYLLHKDFVFNDPNILLKKSINQDAYTDDKKTIEEYEQNAAHALYLGANPNSRRLDSQPLFFSVNSTKLARIFYYQKANFNITDDFGNTILHHQVTPTLAGNELAFKGKDLLKYFLQFSKNINSKNSIDDTPFHVLMKHCFVKGALDRAQLLAHYNLDAFQKNAQGYTPGDIAHQQYKLYKDHPKLNEKAYTQCRLLAATLQDYSQTSFLKSPKYRKILYM